MFRISRKFEGQQEQVLAALRERYSRLEKVTAAESDDILKEVAVSLWCITHV